MKTSHFCIGILLCASFSISACQAGIVLNSPILVENSGLGFGAAPPLLTIDSGPNEAGEVSWDGVMDVKTGDVLADKTETVLVSQISGGVANLGISFNMNEAMNPKQLTLDLLTVKLYLADGTLFDSASIVGGTLTEPGGGQGGDGYFFPLTQMTNELDTFFSDPNNRIGIAASITGSEAGPESFRVVTAVPEPSAFLCLGLLASVAGLRRWQRNRF